MTRPPHCALISGAAKRIGAEIARQLHGIGIDVIIHCHESSDQAQALAATLNTQRDHSAHVVCQDLRAPGASAAILTAAWAFRQPIDILVNNASVFFPTPLMQSNESDWETIMQVNVKAPFFLAHQLAKQSPPPTHIINITDVYADCPLDDHPMYCMSKAALAMMGRSLAKALAPDTLVNNIAPGAICWPENKKGDPQIRKTVLDRTMLGRLGSPDNIAKTVCFLVRDGDYITGQTITVNGGQNTLEQTSAEAATTARRP